MIENRIVLYQTLDGDVGVNVLFSDETFWLTQKGMSALFGVEVNTINYHLQEIFKNNELEEASVIRKFRTTATDGKNYNTNAYSLDTIIAVGYRGNSKKATQFRIWATTTLREFIIKGFVLNDEMLKNGKPFGKDYFRELLERVRSIRASERRIWQQITDIFAECSIDYEKMAQITTDFYAMVQNKFHYAITGKTAAEIIHDTADSKKDNMGLATWKYAPDGRILKSDATTAKNYLSQKEIKQLERTVSGYFDYIEDLIKRENTFTMTDFARSIDDFLSFRKYNILPDKGRISKDDAHTKAKAEYDIFNKTQKIESDFDRKIKQLRGVNEQKH